MKARAAAGETVPIVSEGEHFTFQAIKPKTWQCALKGKAKITGDLLIEVGIRCPVSKPLGSSALLFSLSAARGRPPLMDRPMM
jgi:hypothetical protein